MNISILYIYYLFSFIFFLEIRVHDKPPNLLILMKLAFILTKTNYNITYTKKKIIITYFQKEFLIFSSMIK